MKGDHRLRNGDTLKFGGAGSEFIIETKDFSVFIGKTKQKETIIELSMRFGFGVIQDPSKATYLVLDDDFSDELDSDLVTALLLSKYIVSPSYFTQLTSNPSVFSLALIQPGVVSKKYPMDCWIPQRSRLTTFRNIFEGIKRFFIISEDKKDDEIMINTMRIIGEIIGNIETKCINLCDSLNNFTFNELLILKSSKKHSIAVTNPTRSVSFPSILEALIKSDGQLIDICTIYPETTKTSSIEMSNDIPVKPINEHVTNIEIEPYFSSVKPPESLTGAQIKSINVLTGVSDDYNGPSLTAVQPIPLNFLRIPRPSDSSVSGKTPKFIKCQPKHRQPGTIPALIGPEQLNPVNNHSSALKTDTGMKRRILVKDSWLAEDDFIEDDKKDKWNNIISHPNPNLRISPNPQSKPTFIPTDSHLPTQVSPIPRIPSISSKFQSTFFKNLTKGGK